MLASLLTLSPLIGWGINSKAGTSGAPFLKIGAGPRPTAMGNAFVGLADDVNAAYFNPAGLSYLQRPELLAMHTQWFEDMNYEFGAFAYPTDYGAFALSAATLNVDDIQKRAADESHQGSFEASDAAYSLSYARYMGPLLSLGVTGRYIHQEIDSASAGSWCGDVGFLQKLGRWPLSLGITAKHIGQSVKFRNESDPLPFLVDVGLGANLYRERLKVGINSVFPRDNDPQFGAGSELNTYFGSELRLSMRAGYMTVPTEADGSGLTLGGGLGIGHLNFDVSWVPMGNLGSTFRYSLHIKF